VLLKVKRLSRAVALTSQRGLLHSAPTAVSDEAGSRAAAVYEYILGGDNSPAGPDGDALIDLLYKVNARYRANGTWAMNSTTAGAVRK
jgi:HK97 family phage major capsid protein